MTTDTPSTERTQMLRSILHQPRDCTHQAVQEIPGTGVYGIARTVCSHCDRTFLRRTDDSGPGALFKSKSEGAVPVSPQARLGASS